MDQHRKSKNDYINEINEKIDEEESSRDSKTTDRNTEYSFVSKELDSEMRHIIKEYENYKSKNDKKGDLFMRKIRLKHPIFNLLSNSAFKYIMDNGFLFKL